MAPSERVLKNCYAKNCGHKTMAKGLCNAHYLRLRRHGSLNSRKRLNGEGNISTDGYRIISKKGKRIREHISIAENVLGRPLGKEEVVHHIDENRLNNINSNLLLCTRGYHQLIHQRMRSIKACGDADYRKCTICKKYDDPINLYKDHSTYWHKSCKNLYNRTLKERKDNPRAEIEIRERIKG